MIIRAITHGDVERWLQMRRILWPDSAENILQQEMTVIFDNAKNNQVYVCEVESHDIVAFIEISLRIRVKGCKSSPIAYIEGLYVEPNYRLQGIAKALTAEAENWARRSSCAELAADIAVDNALDQKIQHQLGFDEVKKTVIYCKKIAKNSD